MAPEAHTAKGETDEVDFIRVQSVCASKGTIKKKAAHRQLDEKLLAPLQLRNEFSVIWRRIVMEMKRNLDLRGNLLSHAEMGR